MKVSVVIPARWKSQRLPGKMLANLGGKPVLQHVWERVMRMKGCDEVIIATDNEAVFNAVESWGGTAKMTSEACESGTERVASIIDELQGDFILVVQGDECFIEPDLLEKMVHHFKIRGGDIITPVCRIKEEEILQCPNCVKAVVSGQGKALYFSRSPVPYFRGVPMERWLDYADYWWHVGVYGYKRSVLENYNALKPSRLEQIEKLEQLRFLEAGYEISVVEAPKHLLAVDTQEDLERAEELLEVYA